MSVLYARPSHNIFGTFSSLTPTSENTPDFPKTYLYDGFPHLAFKATSTSVTIVAVYGSAITLDAIILANHNLAGATVGLTNSGGLSTTITIPAVSVRGRCINPWKDLRALGSQRTAVTWTITITGAAANVAIGEILFITSGGLVTMDARIGLKYGATEPNIEHRTIRQVPIRLPLGVRYRRYDIVGGLSTATRAALELLHQDAQGSYRPWPLILSDSVNDVALVTFEGDWSHVFEAPDFEPADLALEEFNMGLIL